MSSVPRPGSILSRGPVGFILRAIFLGIALILLTMFAVLIHALWLGEFHPKPDPAGVIIVLGGTMKADGTLGPDTEDRARTAVELYKQGFAPRIHFTGGIPDEGKPGPGTQMKELALSLGVPDSAMSVEDYSESTLQNALFSKPILGKLAEGPVILVSDGYHLGRSWASFRWAGYGPTSLYAASSLGRYSHEDQATRLLREALAWYFNPVRIVIWDIAGLIGIPDADRINLLD